MSIPLRHAAVLYVPRELIMDHFEDVADFMKPFFVLHVTTDAAQDCMVYRVLSQDLFEEVENDLEAPTYYVRKVPSNVGECILYLSHV